MIIEEEGDEEEEGDDSQAKKQRVVVKKAQKKPPKTNTKGARNATLARELSMTTAVVGGSHEVVDMNVLHKMNNPEQHHPDGSEESHSPNTSERERNHDGEEEESGSFMTEKAIQDEVNRLVALKLDSITESLMAKVETQLLVLLKRASEKK